MIRLRRGRRRRPTSSAATSPPTTRSSTRGCARCRRCSWSARPRRRRRPSCAPTSTTPCSRPALVGEDRVEVSTEVPRLLLAEILRIHLASAPAAAVGLAARAARPGPRARAGRRCTRTRVASGRSRSWRRASLVSASSLDQRFRDVLGMPPIRYLTVWRMHTARSLLSSTELSRRGGRAPGRLRLRGGVQPGVQARPRRLAEPLAGRDERRGLSGLSRRRGVPGRPPRRGRCRAHAASRRTRARPGAPPAPRRRR